MNTLLALACSLMFVSTAQAEFVSYHFTGPGLPPGLDPGLYSSVFQLDTTVPDSDPSANRDLYHDVVPNMGLDVTGGGDFHWNGATGALTIVHEGAVDHISLMTSIHQVSTGYFNMYWDQPPSDLGGFPSLGHISNGSYTFQWEAGHFVIGEPSPILTRALTSVERVGGDLVPTPLPPAVWLFLSGVLALAGRWWIQTRRSSIGVVVS